MQSDRLNSICILMHIYFGHDIYLNLSYSCNLQRILMEMSTCDVEETVHFGELTIHVQLTRWK